MTLATALRSGSPGEPGCRADLEIDRLGGDGIETWTCPLPAVVTVSHEVGELPYIELGRMIQAKARPYEVQAVDEAGLGPGAARPAGTSRAPILVGLARPSDERACHLVEGHDARHAGRELARHLVDQAG